MSRVRAATAVHRRHQQLLGQLQQQHKLVQLHLLLTLLLCFPAIIDCTSSSIFIPNWTWTSSSSSKRDAQQQQAGGGGVQMMDHLLLSLGWSRWSEWSPCSAKCGLEGVQRQSRRCLNLHCSGPRTRHRVCRAELKDCAYPLGNFSSPPVVEPLSLECALRSTAEHPLLAPPGLPQNCSQLLCLSASSASASSSVSVSAPPPSPKNRRQQPLLLSFAQQLRDGQRCRLATDPDPEGQLAVCLHGRCQPVGCDSLVGSRTREDQCGVCGGDGRSCAGKLFRWRDTGHFSPCDRSCGPGGVRVSVSACVNTNTQRLVPDRMCADQPRPRPQVAKCPHVVCPANAHPFGGGVDTRHIARWLTSEWSDCSVTCGPGEQRREVFCAEQSRKRPTGDDGIENNKVLAEMAEENQEAEEQGVDQEEAEEEEERRRVADQYCWHSQRPLETRKCDAGPCPQWAMGDWGPCQAVCGRGIRRRPVQCLAGQRRFHDWHCLLLLNGGGNQQPKPAEEQPCWTGTSCSGGSGSSEETSREQPQQMQQQMQQLLG